MQQTLTTARSNVPDWDMTPYFETFDGTDYQAFHNQLASTLSNLQKNVFQLITEGEIFNPDRWADILTEIEEISSQADHLNSYLICMEAANFRNEAVQHELSAMSVIRASANKILAAVCTGLRGLPC